MMSRWVQFCGDGLAKTFTAWSPLSTELLTFCIEVGISKAQRSYTVSTGKIDQVLEVIFSNESPDCRFLCLQRKH
jgi:hypothetical protein